MKPNDGLALALPNEERCLVIVSKCKTAGIDSKACIALMESVFVIDLETHDSATCSC